MTARVHRARTVPALIAGLGLGLAIGIAILVAHVTGRLAPVYHALGWHSWMTPSAPPPEEQGGMGGMSMPGMPGMDMPSGSAAGQPSDIPGHAIVNISPERQQLIGVRTGTVTKERLRMFVRAVGIVEPDQTRLSRPQVRISGWVTRVYVDFVGQDVKKGDPLLEVYSPDLVATQEEYLIAVEGGQKPLADSARRRLELWGVPSDEIKELARTKKPRDALVLRSDISGRVLERHVYKGMRVEPTTELYRIADLSVVWLQAKIYEYELPHIEIGLPVRVILASQPDKEIKGKVSFVEPVLQETTRTVNVRVALDNPPQPSPSPENQAKGDGDAIKPGMYADLIIDHDMGEGLLVPESAVLRTGERNLAFRVLPGNRFGPVEVKLGAYQFKDKLQVLAGLAEGDALVTSAGFLIDAESRLKSATAAMTGHQHGGSAGPPRKAPPPSAPTGGDKKKPGMEHEHHHHS